MIPDDHVGTDWFHEVIIHDMADANTPYVAISELGTFGLAESNIFVYGTASD